jgi:type II secretory pathway pseudopilin PulG
MKRGLFNNEGQIWIETAIYTLIGLTIIGIVLSIATPQIEKAKERSIISQTNDALLQLNNEIQKVEQSAGSVKIVNFRITKGKLEIDPQNNRTIYTLEDTNLEFSEAGERIKQGDIFIITNKTGRRYDISLELLHEGINVTFNNKKVLKTLHAASAPYIIRIENVGDNEIGDPIHIDFSLA